MSKPFVRCLLWLEKEEQVTAASDKRTKCKWSNWRLTRTGIHWPGRRIKECWLGGIVPWVRIIRDNPTTYWLTGNNWGPCPLAPVNNICRKITKWSAKEVAHLNTELVLADQEWWLLRRRLGSMRETLAHIRGKRELGGRICPQLEVAGGDSAPAISSLGAQAHWRNKTLH